MRSDASNVFVAVYIDRLNGTYPRSRVGSDSAPPVAYLRLHETPDLDVHRTGSCSMA